MMIDKKWKGVDLYNELRNQYILDEDCHYFSNFHVDSERRDGGADVVHLWIAYNHDFYNPGIKHSYLLKKDGSRENGRDFVLFIEKFTSSVFREIISFDMELDNFNPVVIKIKQSLEKE